MDGLLLLDKPTGPSSHDVVARARRALGERGIGHTGTLDPAASGILALVVGKATRLSRFLTAESKEYEAVVRLGVTTSTLDAAGMYGRADICGPMAKPGSAVEAALDPFRGTFLQQPPAYSAKKIGGHRSYALARRAERGPSDERQPAPMPAPAEVTAYKLEVLSVEGSLVTVRVECSSGFYVRSLAHDLGVALATGGHLEALRRTRVGGLTLAEAISLEAIEARDTGRQAAERALIPLERMLPDLDHVVLTPSGVRHAVNGRELGPADGVLPRPAADAVRLMNPEGALVGIARPGRGPGLLHPLIILM